MRSTLNNLLEIYLPEADHAVVLRESKPPAGFPMTQSLREILLSTNIQNMLGKKSRTVKMVGRRAIRTSLIN
jgi:hypothetical protein